jgi:hypothetical protein
MNGAPSPLILDGLQTNEEGNLIIYPPAIDQPGIYWASTDPRLSLAVGMARGQWKNEI